MPSHILLIADDLDQSQLFSLVLRRAGFRVTAVDTGEKALAGISKEPFDLIVTDYMLPDINGDAIINILREAGNTTPIILMSNHVDIHYIGRRSQANACYPKDDIFKLVTLVKGLLPNPSSNGTPLSASA